MAYTTIDDPSVYFHIQLFTGTGSELSVTNDANAGDFKPDWIWIKQRNASTNHGLFDSTRGVTKNLKSDSSDAESTEVQSVKTFNTDGFTLGTSGDYNGSSDTHVAWQWKANGGTTASNTSGSINSTVQANTTAGFSIVTYTGNNTGGATIGHGLGSTPNVIIVKVRSAVDPWSVYHSANTSAPETDYLVLDSTAATADHSNRWQDTAPTSTLITLGASGTVNGNGLTYVAYCFAEKQGYSKFGSYTGNGNADGPFIYTGFKPSMIIKKGTGSGDWHISDNKQNSSNPHDNALRPNENNVTETGNTVDFLSNGFKVRNTGGSWNSSGNSYIYMAFAEHPFVSSEGVPCTAR